VGRSHSREPERPLGRAWWLAPAGGRSALVSALAAPWPAARQSVTQRRGSVNAVGFARSVLAAPPAPDRLCRMLSQRVSRLFHGVVVVGTTLGCGGHAGDRKAPAASDTSPAPPEPDPALRFAPAVPASTTPATFPGAPRPDDCDSPEQFSCESFTAYPACAYYGVDCELAACSCDGSRPTRPDDCEHAQQFQCEPGLYGGYVVGCECDAMAPVEAAECDQPQQFQCSASAPDTSCVCNSDAPLDASACPASQRFSCRSYDPPTSCRCVMPIILR
jgi:hypothetical protein